MFTHVWDRSSDTTKASLTKLCKLWRSVDHLDKSVVAACEQYMVPITGHQQPTSATPAPVLAKLPVYQAAPGYGAPVVSQPLAIPTIVAVPQASYPQAGYVQAPSYVQPVVYAQQQAQQPAQFAILGPAQQQPQQILYQPTVLQQAAMAQAQVRPLAQLNPILQQLPQQPMSQAPASPLQRHSPTPALASSSIASTQFPSMNVLKVIIIRATYMMQKVAVVCVLPLALLVALLQRCLCLLVFVYCCPVSQTTPRRYNVKMRPPDHASVLGSCWKPHSESLPGDHGRARVPIKPLDLGHRRQPQPRPGG